MNLTNELDLAMDEAVKRHLGRVFDIFFQSTGTPEARLQQLTMAVDQLEGDMKKAVKALESL